jgi:hypothetical protein
MPNAEFQTAVKRLQALPEEAQADLAPKLNQYLNRLDDLRRAIRVGLESGEPKPGQPVMKRLERKYRDMM